MVADIGGGHATLITAILLAHPDLRGLVLDLPYVVPSAEAKIKAAGISDRCEVVAGDFFESVPGGADCYSWPTCFTTGMTSARLQSCATAAMQCAEAEESLSSNE